MPRRNPRRTGTKHETGAARSAERRPPAAAGFSLSLPVAAAVLGLACLAAYSNSFRAELLLDNQTIILRDPRLTAASWQNVWDIFTRHYWWPSLESHLFRPLTTLSYWFNYSVLGNGAHPPGYHAVNLLLHWVNATLAFALVRAVTRRPYVALAAAAAFAVHPLTVESVTNVVGRADLLAGMSVMGGLLLYIRFKESTGRRALVYLAGLGASFLAGVFCKESAVALPGIMLLYDATFPAADAPSLGASVRLSFARIWPGYACVLPGLAALLAARWALFRNSPLFGEFASDNPIVIAPLWTGVMTAVKVAGYYLALMAWPAKLSCDYSYDEITLFGWSLTSGQDAHAWIALAVLLGVAAGAAFAWRRDRGIFFFVGFAAVAFLPTANVLLPIGTIMAERLMYLPLVGAAAAVALVLAAAGRRLIDAVPRGARWSLGVALTVAVVGVLAALAGRTVARNEDWTSSERLWSSSAEAAPDSIKVIRALAAAAMASDPSGGRAGEAVDIAMRGVRITEQHPLPLHHLPAALFADIGYYDSTRATLLAARGEPAAAHDLFGRAVAMLERAAAIDREINRVGRERLLRSGLKPEDVHDTGTATIYRNLGAAYLGFGDPERAIQVLSYMVHVQPGSFDALHVLALAQGAAAQSERAAGHAARADDLLEQAAVNLIAALLLNPAHDASWEPLAQIYRLLALPADAVRTVEGRQTLNLDYPVVQRHLRLAGAQLVRQLAEGGLAGDAERWRQRLIAEFQMPPELFAPVAKTGADRR